jgi:DNA-binding response OmpR family regulator
VAERKRVLVVDEEADLLELISYDLKKEGFDVRAAANGEEASEAIRTESPDRVVLDLMLPGIQGMELCRILRADSRTSSLPVIMLTAKTDDLERVLGLEMGADEYVTKPISPRELKEQLLS